MKRLFIIGASILQLPAILKAKEMGLYVAVADYNPEAIGIKFADEYYNVSTMDEEGIFEAAKKFKADGIMTLATDQPMKALAYTANKLNLNGISYEVAINATNKAKQRLIFQNANLEIPWFKVVTDENEFDKIKYTIKYPCICKPVDSAGSKGVIFTDSKSKLLDNYNYAKKFSQSGVVVIEEFLTGKEVSVEILIVEEDVHILNVTDKLTTKGLFFVEKGHSQPSKLSNEELDRIKKLAKDAVKSLNINTGAAHVEIMLTKEAPKIIEVGARMGGDCITTHLVPLSTGIDMVKAVIQLALGETPNIEVTENNGAAIRFIEGKKGILKSINGISNAKNAKGVIEVSVTKNQGDNIDILKSSNDRLGYIIAVGENSQDASCNCESALDLISVEVDSIDETY